MMERYIIDTNVLITANRALGYQATDEAPNYPNMIKNSIDHLLRIKENGCYVVLDFDDEIFGEYRKYMNLSGQNAVGDAFFEWLNDTRWSYPSSERIKLHKIENGYKEFPQDMELVSVDPSDKKFFAVSNAHHCKPPILEATDSKWWGWKDAANRCGIRIIFMDEKYMKDHSSV